MLQGTKGGKCSFTSVKKFCLGIAEPFLGKAPQFIALHGPSFILRIVLLFHYHSSLHMKEVLENMPALGTELFSYSASRSEKVRDPECILSPKQSNSA